MTVEIDEDMAEKLADLCDNPGSFNEHKPPMTYEERVKAAYELRRQLPD